MRISDGSSDVCSSDLLACRVRWSLPNPQHAIRIARAPGQPSPAPALPPSRVDDPSIRSWRTQQSPNARMANPPHSFDHEPVERSHELHLACLLPPPPRYRSAACASTCQLPHIPMFVNHTVFWLYWTKIYV